MLKEITINILVLAKLFANAKPLYKGYVLRATVGREKTSGLVESGLKPDPTTYQLPGTSSKLYIL